jgi:hypothetical protein
LLAGIVLLAMRADHGRRHHLVLQQGAGSPRIALG